jgi:signal-transduction protein with cAMP-binding, CBS, and nucleotidyltransferase domain
MPRLANRRHEWFAYMRAHGRRLEDAYERAGYAPDRGHACRLASRPEVAERITELRSDFTDVVTADRPQVIEALMSIANTCKALGTPDALKEARFAYLEAARLQQQIAEELARDRDLIEQELGRLPARERRGKVAELNAPAEPGPAPATAPDQDLAERAA